MAVVIVAARTGNATSRPPSSAATAGDSPISDIVLRVGTIEPQGQADDTASSGEFSKVGPPSLPSEALAEVALHVQAIEDPDIRTHLAEVMARALASSSAPKLRP